LPDFPWYNIPNWGKIYQITIKYSKRPQNITYGLKIDQMNINIPTNIGNYNTLENLPKLGFLVLKIYHLATLEVSSLEFTEMAVSKKSKGNRGAV
jgi:hypothetical protein